jgi:hypothetical protein
MKKCLWAGSPCSYLGLSVASCHHHGGSATLSGVSFANSIACSTVNRLDSGRHGPLS